MVIIITGATHTGKTKLAQRLLEKYKYPYLSIDHLKMGLIRSGNTELTVSDDEELTVYLWRIVCEIIKTAIENDQNLIVEGCYVPFDWKNDFSSRYLPSIEYLCLAFSDSYIDSHFTEITAHASDIEARTDDVYCTPFLIKKENNRFIEGCIKHGNRLCLIANNYDKAINDLL